MNNFLTRSNKPLVAGLKREDVEDFLFHHFRYANLQKSGNVRGTKDQRFTSNEEFWKRVLSLERLDKIGLRWVELIGFQLVDWYPRSPGLFHTTQAIDARNEAEKYVTEEGGICFYEPQGKYHMLQGGIGAVRFKPITIGGTDYWLYTATSDIYCHTGIPISIPNDLIDRIGYAFNSSCKITGQVRFLPAFLEDQFTHLSRIPQIYIQVDNVQPLGRERKPAVRITPIVFFRASQEMGLDRKENVTYVTCSSDSLIELSRSAEWLEEYAEKYHGIIQTNFDQQQPVFADAPFSLQHVMSGKVDRYVLQEYHIEHAEIVCKTIETIHSEAMNMTQISVTLGDGTVVHGDVVVAKTIENSFNKVQTSDIPEGLKRQLKEFTKAVASMNRKLPKESAEQVARDLQTLTDEATSKSPRKEWWTLSIDGLTKAAKNVGEIGKPVIEIAGKLIPLLTAISK